MSKYFKPYIYLVYTLGILTMIFSYSKSSIQFNLTLFLIIIFIIVSEVKSISLSENSFLSLLSVFAVFSLSIVPIFSSLIAICIASIIVDIIRVYTYKIYDSIFNIKSFFNIAMNIFCLYISYIIGFVFIKIQPLNIIVGIIVFDILNRLLLDIVLKLYDRKSSLFELKKDDFYMLYYYILISIMLYYSYLAYKDLGILIVAIFIISYQYNALNKNNKGEIEKNIFNDTLTNANNRTSLNNDIGDKLLNRVPFSLIFLDFDNFKEINDMYSHSIGDKALIHFVDTMQKEIDSKIYRYGGDEFCLIVNKKDDSQLVIDKLRSISNLFVIKINDQTLNYSVSYGKFDYLGTKMSIEELFYISSHNMHENKIEKKATIVVN